MEFIQLTGSQRLQGRKGEARHPTLTPPPSTDPCVQPPLMGLWNEKSKKKKKKKPRLAIVFSVRKIKGQCQRSERWRSGSGLGWGGGVGWVEETRYVAAQLFRSDSEFKGPAAERHAGSPLSKRRNEVTQVAVPLLNDEIRRRTPNKYMKKKK